MPFFIRKGAKDGSKTKKRKLSPKRKSVSKKKHAPSASVEKIDSDEICSDNDSDGAAARSDAETESDTETAQDKRLRIAKLYLEEIKRQEEERGGDVETRLRDEVLDKAGRLQCPLADKLALPVAPGATGATDVAAAAPVRLRYRRQRLPVTCAVATDDGRCLFAGAKCGSVIKWNLVSMRREAFVAGAKKSTKGHKGHSGQVLSIAISSDSKYLVTGDSAALILLWCPAALERLHVLRGHRGPVTALAFQRGSHQLFSGAADRLLKVWSVDDRTYIETLFGHQSGIAGVDALSRQRAVSCGGYDNTVRVWKLVEESQLVFTGRGTSVDCVALINDHCFVTAGEDGYISLWSSLKKRPVCSVPLSHGRDPVTGEARGVTALAVQRNSDLVASGSWDGWLRVWRCSSTGGGATGGATGSEFDTLSPLLQLAAAGFVNALCFSGAAERLVAALGREHRLGRWWCLPEARNHIAVFRLARK